MFILIVIYFHVGLWIYNLRSFSILRKKDKVDKDLAKEVLVPKCMCLISFCMSFMMLFSTNLPTRSFFPGTVQLIIAAVILLRIQDEYSINLISDKTKRLLHIVGLIYFIVSTASTFYGFVYSREQIHKLIFCVKSSDYAKNNVILVSSFHPVHDKIDKLSHFHLIDFKLSEDEDNWCNVAFSRYYGIKGVRMVKKDGTKYE